jgi:hypothetical protein
MKRAVITIVAQVVISIRCSLLFQQDIADWPFATPLLSCTERNGQKGPPFFTMLGYMKTVADVLCSSWKTLGNHQNERKDLFLVDSLK